MHKDWPIIDNRHHQASMKPARNGCPQDRPPQILDRNNRIWISPAPDRALLAMVEKAVGVEHSMDVDLPLFRLTKLDSLRDAVVQSLPRARTRLPILSSWTVVLPTRVEAHVARSRPSDGQLMSSIFFQRQLRGGPGVVTHDKEDTRLGDCT